MTPGAAKEWLSEINLVLHKEWNPIGCDVPQDEYESYVGPLATLLLQGASDQEIASHLNRVELESFGIEGSFPINRFDPVIAALRELGVPK